MYRRIIVGYETSPQSEDALALGKLLAETAGAELIAAWVYLMDPWYGSYDLPLKPADEELAREIERAAQVAGGEPEAVPSSSPARGLHELVEERRADLVVVGSSRQGPIGKALAGTTAQRLFHRAPCAVAVAPPGYRERAARTLHTIAVASDGTAVSLPALEAATELAVAAHASLRIVRLDEPGSGDRPELVLEQADGADVLVAGSHAYGPLRRALRGSTSARLAETAACPLIVYPRGAPARMIGPEPRRAA